MRIGHGYDVHKLVEDRALILGGVRLEHSLGLLGHSDADVLTHAVMDALLGAAGLGDIGQMFPDTDPQFEGADSLVLLARVAERLKAAGFRVGNVDATIIAQKPRLAGAIPQMRENLARVLGVPPERVNVKATTEERLGFTGREEGIAAHAVALLEEIKWEKSCGAVIFREEDGGRSYLVLRSTQGHTTLCKGHVEGDETEHETAIREIMEETALTVEFLDGFREVITYSPYEGCVKDVVFFLARAVGGVLTCQPEEVAEAQFLPVEQALAVLTHDSDRDVLRKACDFFRS